MNMIQMIMGLMQFKNNPNAAIQSLMGQNPQAQTIINQMQSSGLSPEQFAKQFAKQNNVDINQIVGFMNQNGIKLK